MRHTKRFKNEGHLICESNPPPPTQKGGSPGVGIAPCGVWCEKATDPHVVALLVSGVLRIVRANHCGSNRSNKHNKRRTALG